MRDICGCRYNALLCSNICESCSADTSENFHRVDENDIENDDDDDVAENINENSDGDTITIVSGILVLITQATKTKKGQITDIIHVEANFGRVVGEGVLSNKLKVLMGGGGAKGAGDL
ncbi:hypothetical protein JTB14_021632 [Gonioctena quinquepunctata]|nr:hypothetical protein JTB14_021632 [Gonioctena quinquepunctata]